MERRRRAWSVRWLRGPAVWRFLEAAGIVAMGVGAVLASVTAAVGIVVVLIGAIALLYGAARDLLRRRVEHGLRPFIDQGIMLLRQIDLAGSVRAHPELVDPGEPDRTIVSLGERAEAWRRDVVEYLRRNVDDDAAKDFLDDSEAPDGGPIDFDVDAAPAEAHLHVIVKRRLYRLRRVFD